VASHQYADKRPRHIVGNTVELRETPKAPSTKLVQKWASGQGNDLGYGNIGGDRLGPIQLVAMQWTIRIQAPKGIMPMEKVQRLGGSGLTFCR
jgi:hypothetical protein